jgi:hypothetical protein
MLQLTLKKLQVLNNCIFIYGKYYSVPNDESYQELI